MVRCLKTLLLATALFVPARGAQAQSLSSLINALFTYGDCGQPLCLVLSGPDSVHQSHFIPAVTQGSQSVLGFLSQSIGRTTANLPISATSSGVTFKIVDGLPVKTSTSAGPIFAERSQTLGKGRFFVGANVSGISFSSLNSAPLADLRFNFGHQDVGAHGLGDPILENDLIFTQLSLSVDQQVATVFGTWGILDFVDIGVAVPMVRVSLAGTSTSQITPFGPVATHRFGGDPDNPQLDATKTVSGSASGIGDIAARVKINLGQGDQLGAAILTDIRLPTGREEDFLGSGSASVRVMGIVGAQLGNLAPHLNLGYAARSATTENDAFLTTIGFDALVAPWATMAAELITEWQVGDSKIQLPDPIEFVTPFHRIYPATSIPTKRQDVVNASFGAKFTVRGGMVIVVNGIVPIKHAGLQPNFGWTTGLEYTF